MVALPLSLEQVKHIVGQLPARERAQLRATLPTRAFFGQGASVNSVAVEEMLAFLTAGPSQKALAEFRISDAAQHELDDLLEKNREAEIDEIELERLDAIVELLGLFNLLKIRARKSLAGLL